MLRPSESSEGRFCLGCCGCLETYEPGFSEALRFSSWEGSIAGSPGLVDLVAVFGCAGSGFTTRSLVFLLITLGAVLSF